MTQFKVDFNDFKRRDNTNLMEITLYKDSGEQITPNRDHQWLGKVLKFGDGDKRLGQELAVTLDSDKIGVPSKQLENLPSGDYGLELWEVNNDSKTIYPSAGFVEFHIHRNADESLESVTPTIDIDKVIDDLHQAGLNVVVDDIEMLAPDAKPSVTSEVRDGKNHIKLHIPHGLDNTSLTKAPAFVSLQTQVNNSAVGTNLYTDTKNFGNLASWAGSSSWTKTTDTYNGFTVVQTTGRWSGLSQYTQVKKGDVLTYSVYAKYTSGTGISAIYWQIVPQGEVSYNAATVNSITTNVTITDSWQRVSGTTVVTSDGYLRPRIELDNDSTNTMQIAGIKVEKGSVATDWCPNPTEILTRSDYAKIKAAIVALGGSLS